MNDLTSQRHRSFFDQFWTIVLLAAGIAGMGLLFSSEVAGWGNVVFALLQFCGSGALIGAGLLSPFRQKYLGAVLGSGLLFLLSAIASHSEGDLLGGLLVLIVALMPWLLWRRPRS